MLTCPCELTCRAAGNESHIITPQEAKSLCPLLKVDDLEVKPHNVLVVFFNKILHHIAVCYYPKFFQMFAWLKIL